MCDTELPVGSAMVLMALGIAVAFAGERPVLGFLILVSSWSSQQRCDMAYCPSAHIRLPLGEGALIIRYHLRRPALSDRALDSSTCLDVA